MKSTTIILAVALALSSTSPVFGMPYSLDLMPDVPARPPAWMKRSLLDHQSTDDAPTTVVKRATGQANAKSSYSSKKYAKASDDDGGDGDDDDDDDCDELSDAEDEPKGFANHHFKMGGNATTSGRTPSVPSTQSNSYKPTARYSPAPGYSGSRNGQSTSSKGWYTSPTRPPNVASYSSYSQSSSSSSYSQSSTHSQYGENGSAGSYHGKATFFSQDGNPGACGKTHQDSDYIVAIQSEMYEGGKFCGKTVVVTRKSTGQSIRCIAADACPGCPSNQSLDLSIAAFNALGKAEEGVFDITWDVVD